jgi:hypothetical protein
MQAANSTKKMREAVEIARSLDLISAHDRRKPQDFGLGIAVA